MLEEKCDNDVDRLCELIRKKRAYVEDRLLLAYGDKEILGALHAGEISMAVAKELNDVTDAVRRLDYLKHARRGGATARIIRHWREEGEYFDSLQTPTPQPPPVAQKSPEELYGQSIVCAICGSKEDPADMEWGYVHRSCQRVAERRRNLKVAAAPAERQEDATE